MTYNRQVWEVDHERSILVDGHLKLALNRASKMRSKLEDIFMSLEISDRDIKEHMLASIEILNARITHLINEIEEREAAEKDEDELEKVLRRQGLLVSRPSNGPRS